MGVPGSFTMLPAVEAHMSRLTMLDAFAGGAMRVNSAMMMMLATSDPTTSRSPAAARRVVRQELPAAAAAEEEEAEGVERRERPEKRMRRICGNDGERVKRQVRR